MPVETSTPEAAPAPAPTPELVEATQEQPPEAVEPKPTEPEAPELVADDLGNVEEAEPEWDPDLWSGDLEDVPEKYRGVAKGIVDRFTATIRENEQIISALERALDATGDDPRLEQLRQDLEARNQELENHRRQLEEANGKFSALQSEYKTQAEQWEGLVAQREQEDMARFSRENPKLTDPDSKEYARLQEILDDEGEEDLWDFWDLPALVGLKKPEYSKVKKLRQEGVPTKYAIQLATAQRSAKEDTRLPDAALAGAAGRGSRTPAPRTVKEAPDLKSKLELIAENAILRSVK